MVTQYLLGNLPIGSSSLFDLICQLCSVFDKKPSRRHDFEKVNLQSLQWCIGLCVLTQPSSLGLEFKYKSQEVFPYLALVFEDSFQTTLRD